MKKNLLIFISIILFSACSGNIVRDSGEDGVATRAQFINNGYNIEVHIPKDLSDIVFTINDSGELKIDISTQEMASFDRILISDGRHHIRVIPTEEKFVIKGKTLETFKKIVEGRRNVTIKGRVSTHNYFVQNIASEDIMVVGRIFQAENQRVKL